MKKIFILKILLVIAFILSKCSTSSEIILVSDLHYPEELKIINRLDWGWHPISKISQHHKINKITIHHSGEIFSEDKDIIQYLKNLQIWSRREKNWIDIPYHFMIDLSGNIYEARPINFPGDTNTDYNVIGHALICVVGNYEVQNINHNQLNALVNLVSFLKNKFKVSSTDIKGHKDYTSQTVCPGKNLYKYIADGTIIRLVNEKNQIAKNDIKIKTGIEVLRNRNFDLLKGKRVGLITNPTGVDSKLKSTIDILFETSDVNLVALFGPEHGVRGNYSAGEYVDFYVDEKTQLPVYSLYGRTRKPTPEMLKDIDVLVYDIQDIGSRSYTYISTMGLVMEAAAENNKEVVILDRPNPLGGIRIEGNIVEDGFYSFVSQFPIPYIHGLTVGELALLLNEERLLSNKMKCKLTIVRMEGWNRNMIFEKTGLPWVLTSPHIPHPYTPFYYAASGIIGELRNILSIGVGYTLPFQTFAAEWINPLELSQKMNSFNLQGVVFRPITYKPYYAFGKDKMLNGVQIHITDYQNVELLPIQFYFLQAVYELYNKCLITEGNNNSMFDKVLGTSKIRELFIKNHKVEDIIPYLKKDIDKFKQTAKKYYLYN
jgi:uncharacterized protein YbbC (DUF1343 family)